MSPRELNGPSAHLFAIAVVGLTFAAEQCIEPYLAEPAPLLLFTIPVLAAALTGGLRPGLLATLLSGAVGAVFVLDPRGHWSVSEDLDRVRLGPPCWRATPTACGRCFGTCCTTR
jgi:K+-sensing histidine kinase KdpD